MMTNKQSWLAAALALAGAAACDSKDPFNDELNFMDPISTNDAVAFLRQVSCGERDEEVRGAKVRLHGVGVEVLVWGA